MMTPNKHLIDAIDLLNEARHLNEATFLAAEGLKTAQHRGAFTQLAGTIADRLTEVEAMLNRVRTGAE